MRNTFSSGSRRGATLALLIAMLFAVAVGSVSAAPSAFAPVSPGSATAPGPEITDLTPLLPLTITWEKPTGTGTISYAWSVIINGGTPVDIPVPAGQINDSGANVVWTPAGVELTAIVSALSSNNGNYEWYVTATDEDGSTQSSSFFFRVNLPLGAFNLTGPADEAYVRSLPASVPITWTRSTNAESYAFTLFKISNNVRIGEIVTLNLTAAQVGCAAPDATTCTLNANFADPALTTGTYAWTVVASAPAFSPREASNAPFFFSLNLEPIELVRNGGFELQTLGRSQAFAQGWNRPDGAASGRRDCRANLIPANTNGTCAFRGTRAQGAFVQTITAAELRRFGLNASDSLSVSARLQANTEPPAGSLIRITVDYNGGVPSQNIRIPLTAATYGAEFSDLTGDLTGIQLEGEVRRIRVRIISASVFYLDDLSIVVDGFNP